MTADLLLDFEVVTMICLAAVANSCTSFGFSHCCKTANCWLKRANHHLNLDPVLSTSTGLAGFRMVIVITTHGGGGTTRPLPGDGGAEKLRGDSTVGPHPKVWTIDRE